MFHLIQDVFSNQWLIHKESALAYLPHLIAYIKGADLKINNEAFNARVTPYYIDARSQVVTPWEMEEGNVPENSIAVIPVMGAVRKYGYNGTVKIQNRIRMAEDNENVIAILFLFETPGGMVTNTDLTAEMIKNCTKPTVGFAQGMVASAGMWMFSACDYRIIQSKLDRIGSIGVMASITDVKKLEEKWGFSVKDIYATLSTKKNEAIRALFDKADESLMVEHLDYINDEFHACIRENLGINKDSEVFTGKIYFAEEGVSLGLANEINSLDYALEYAENLGLIELIKNNYVNN